MLDNQTNIFEMLYQTFKIKTPIKLITLFSGYDSQALALKYLGVDFELYKTCEWAIKSIQALKDLHFGEDNTDYSKDMTLEQIKEYLFNKGISSNYNDPMTKKQVNRLNEKQVRTIYNNIKATHNLVNIQQVKGNDLEIKDKDKYCYIMTYSFPCQDLSLAGKGKGMSDTSTRSGMLWEVERILSECEDKPQILLMENVPQVHGEGNKEDFNKWQLRLEEMGYKNYWRDLIATDYGIPQTRNRCFMVSLLGDYNYTFPKPIPLKLKLKDMLEDNVDEKYYLSEKGMEYICGNAFNPNLKDMYDRNNALLNRNNAYCLNTKIDRRAGDSNYILEGYGETTIKDYLKIKNATKQGYLEATDGDGIDISSRMQHHRGTVQKDKAQTLTTQCDRGVVVNMKTESCNNLIKEGKVKENDITRHSYTTARSEEWEKRNVEQNNLSPTLDTRCDCLGVVNNMRIRKLTPKECFRLMGVKDEDFEKIAKNQSDSSLYHLAGDSIVVNVLTAIFKEMILWIK